MSASHKISVVIADDHAVMRAGLRLLLSSQGDIRVVGEAGDHQGVLALLDRHRGMVDIITLDLTMPGGSPASLIEDILRAHPATHVVVLTMHDDPAYARMALAAGARGYVVKSAADTELITAIRTVARGGMHSTLSIADGVGGERRLACASVGTSTGRPAVDSLSEREREVLLLVAQGHTNQQVADRLFLSVKTVESYRSRMMTKLGLKDRSELTRLAIDSGLLAGKPT